MNNPQHYETAAADRISFPRKLIYGFGAFVNNILAAAIGSMVIVLNLGLGMNPALVGLVSALPRLTDAFTGRLLELAEVKKALPKKDPLLLKINISWHKFYPACSTTPWQLEGTILALKGAGFEDLVDVHNRTVVTIADLGDRYNKFGPVLDKYGIPKKYNFKPEDMTWVEYKPQAKMLALDHIFPDGIHIPVVVQIVKSGAATTFHYRQPIAAPA